MMTSYIRICDDDEEFIELPLEADDTLLLTTLTAQFPGATGLKYKVDNLFRGIRLTEGKFHPPDGFWGKSLYHCVFPKENKRKFDDSTGTGSQYGKTKRVEQKNVCTDLIVLGLPWKVTDEDLRDYFSQYGELVMAMVKHDPQTGQSKGYGFVRFNDMAAQKKVLSIRHNIQGRLCDVKIPNSKDGKGLPTGKIFVGRVTQDMSVACLREFFTQYGEVMDIYIPKPFRSFAFVTFADSDVADSLYGQDLIINGVSVHISEASPKLQHQQGPNAPNGAGAAGRYMQPPPGTGFNNGYNYPPDYGDNDNTAALLSALGINPAAVAALNQAGIKLRSERPAMPPIGNNSLPYGGPNEMYPGQQRSGNSYNAAPWRGSDYRGYQKDSRWSK